MIALRNGGAELDLLAEVGGAVARFAVDGRAVLRPAPPDTRDVLQMACFPLVPFANRIANGRFSFAGEAIEVPRNFGDHPHALHGQGWQNPWRVVAKTAASATLAFDHPADSWPWDYAARLTYDLKPHVLRMTLELANVGARAMPASLGFHPYFLRTPDTRLRATVAGVWLSDETCIPTARSGPASFLDLAHGAALADAPFVDHCHHGWNGTALIEQAGQGRAIAISASPELSFLHCYVPLGADFFCVEPVSAMPDAFNRPPALGGLRVLAPGEVLSAVMTISVSPLALPIGHPH